MNEIQFSHLTNLHPPLGWNPMEQVHDKVRRQSEQNEKRISKSTFWRMLGPNLQKIITRK